MLEETDFKNRWLFFPLLPVGIFIFTFVLLSFVGTYDIQGLVHLMPPYEGTVWYQLVAARYAFASIWIITLFFGFGCIYLFIRDVFSPRNKVLKSKILLSFFGTIILGLIVVSFLTMVLSDKRGYYLIGKDLFDCATLDFRATETNETVVKNMLLKTEGDATQGVAPAKPQQTQNGLMQYDTKDGEPICKNGAFQKAFFVLTNTGNLVTVLVVVAICLGMVQILGRADNRDKELAKHLYFSSTFLALGVAIFIAIYRFPEPLLVDEKALSAYRSVTTAVILTTGSMFTIMLGAVYVPIYWACQKSEQAQAGDDKPSMTAAQAVQPILALIAPFITSVLGSNALIELF